MSVREIRSHSHTRPHLSKLTTPKILMEIRGSATWIKKELNFKPVSIAYPYGDYDYRTLFLAKNIIILEEP